MNIIVSYLNTIIGFAKLLPSVILGVIVGWLAIKIIIFFLLRAMRLTKVPRDIRGLIATVTRLALWVTLIIVMSQVIGLGSLAVAITGSAAIVAFFLSASIGPLLSNIFSGLFLVGDPDIKAGMRITTNDGKTTGVIKGIDMRKVRIEDDKGLLHVVPNSAVENTEWIILERKSKKIK
jgi:small-conductance mechanosensitive channel